RASPANRQRLASRVHPSTRPLRTPSPDRSRHLTFYSYFSFFFLNPAADHRRRENKKPTADLATVGFGNLVCPLALDESSHSCGALPRQMPARHPGDGAGAHRFNYDACYVHFFTPSLLDLSIGVNFY